jgi:hypothetical protein
MEDDPKAAPAALDCLPSATPRPRMNDPHANDCNCSNGCTVSIGSDVLVVSAGRAAGRSLDFKTVSRLHAKLFVIANRIGIVDVRPGRTERQKPDF